MKAVERPQFTLDVADEVAYLAEHASALTARRWHASVKATIRFVRRQPGAGRPRTDLHPEGMRSIAVQKFRSWLIFYRQTGRVLEFLRVKHGAMHLPGLFTPLDVSED